MRSLASRFDKRLVEQKYFRLPHDGAAHRDALALAAGELPRLAVEHRADFENARGFLDAGVDLGLRHAAVAQAIGHVVVDAHMRIERVILEHHGDVALGRLDLVDDAPADVDLAAGDGLEPRDHPQQRGLAAAGGADQHAELAVADLQADALDRLKAARIGLADVLRERTLAISLLRLDKALDEQALHQHDDRDRRQHGEHGGRHRHLPFGQARRARR